MKKWVYCILIIFILAATSSFAIQSGKGTEKADYQKEVEKIKKENPKKYEEMKRDVVLMAEWVLAELGYGIEPFDAILDEKTRSAIRVYEKKRNIPETGDPLSFDTMEQLQADMNTMQHQTVSLPRLSFSTSLWDKGYVSASGTWILSNDKMGEPEQTTKITCDRAMNVCTEAVAIVQGKGSDRSLYLDVDTYEIERWDDREIVTKPLEFGCVRHVRRFNKIQKTVTGIRSTISNVEMCKDVETKEMYMELTDGFKVYWERAQELNKKRWQLMNIAPSLRQSIESQKKNNK